ncbi:hypothetical protein [Flavobacterium sp. NKUCC04_CG]|uniref:hypothetical protein n=1 Tax=Flavobacterium sp. NKUCC04_CG TaxID=2842121 RepID=UPI001C5B6564|nr:hypothetical protein [Flavobacterium sp. NKUCC04_CG]MBW3518080.1 hypothetical protein [Flavobacterium sp. NKUCC04_CG]
MRLNKNLIGVILFFVFLNNGYSQITLEVVVEKFVANLGATEHLEKLKSVKIKQLVFNANSEIPQTLIIENKESFYQSSLMSNGQYIIAVKRDKGWMLNPYLSTSKVTDLSIAQQKQFLYQANLLSPLYDYYSKSEDSKKIKKIVLLEKTEKVEWDNCYVIALTYNNDFEEKLYIDSKKFTLRKIKNMIGEVIMSNYKRTDGINFPMYREFVGANNLKIITEILSININPQIDESIFKKPE